MMMSLLNYLEVMMDQDYVESLAEKVCLNQADYDVFVVEGDFYVIALESLLMMMFRS